MAWKKYGGKHFLARVFILGHPGAGKSSLIEALKREGFFDLFSRISESSVPPHTAGIVPRLHTSKHYGRVLFYDFAGAAEYYSSHAAILENLISTRNGDNIFIIVVDLRQDNHKIRSHLNYWVSFIQHQIFKHKKPYLIVIGSHLDLVHKTKGLEFKKLCESIQSNIFKNDACFMLDCCKPRSKKMKDVVKHITTLTREFPSYVLSAEGSILLGLLEKDFSNVIACSIQIIISHIKNVAIPLPTDIQSLGSILLELHEAGLLFVIKSDKNDVQQIILNMSRLTRDVHQVLFSAACQSKISSFNVGIIPESILAQILPPHVTKECLILLQYCQEISHKDAHAFPSLTPSDSTTRSFLFFPALCSADKSDVAWVTPPDLSYGIGWLARCTDPCDYFPPRFLHVLLLRLVFRFTISVPPPSNQALCGTSDHSYFQRRCTMWKTGVHWLMEEGVECMVELVSANKEVVVLTNSVNDRAENCATVFNSIVSCVMEAKADFCHSIRPEFFILDSVNLADYLNYDNLFAMNDVERALTYHEGNGSNKILISITGRRRMELAKISCLRQLTPWQYLFPIHLNTVLQYLKKVDPHTLGPHLGIPQDDIDAIEEGFPALNQMRRELVKKWMSSSLDPPCWWHLVQVLRRVDHEEIAEEINQQHNLRIQLQEKLLDRHNHSLKPDSKFLKSFASVVESKWPSLAASLSLSESEIEDVKGERLTDQDRALHILKRWASREDATYCQLYERLQIVSLFQWAKL